MQAGVVLAGLGTLVCACGGSSEKASIATASPANGRVHRGAAPSRYSAAVGGKPAAQSVAPSHAAVNLAPTHTALDANSTFAIDVDTASYTLARAQLDAGILPDPSVVRTEEFVNAFDMTYPDPTDTFGITADGTPSLFDPSKMILRVGLQSTRPQRDARKPATLTFVLDVSGSMAEPNKLDLVKESMDRLVDALRPNDRVQIVVYSNASRVVLPATEVEHASDIHEAIAGLHPEGSTNAEAGLKLGYHAAREAFRDGDINRVILATDGLANQGDTSPDHILDEIKSDAGKGIQLVVLGFGAEANNDALMERVADRGDGFYAFVDGPGEAHRLFVENLTSTLDTIAIDAKVQVGFDSRTVTSYRLLGYDDRAVADRDFTNDKVDGGEVGAGHSVTALYELELAPEAAPEAALGSVHVRWKAPGTLQVRQMDQQVPRSALDDRDAISPRLRLATVAGAFAEALGARERTKLDAVAREADVVAAQLAGDADAAELASLCHIAVRLAP